VIKRKRSKTWRKSADKALKDARALAFDPKVRNAADVGHDAAVDNFSKAINAAMAGIMRSGGKNSEGSETQKRRSKYEPIITECDARKIPLGPPHTKERIDAVMIVAAEVAPELTRSAVLKFLQRHYK
jgi:hypothetical protein